MSRIYNNESLSTLSVSTHNVQTWCIENFTKSGTGVLLEGCVCGKSRHMLLDKQGKKYRYYVIYVKVKQAHHRKFEPSGKEVTPNFSETAKVSTGYLMSSYKTTDKGTTDKIPIERLADLLGKPDLLKYTSGHAKPGTIGFWIEEKYMEQLEIAVDDTVRIKTNHDSPFVENIVRVEESSKSVSNMAGDEQVGSSWTDKVLMNKSTKDTPQNSNIEGVDEDEWDD